MKLIPVIYFGFTGMDCRFSTPMLPWIVCEIRKRDFCEKLSLGVEYGVLQAYNPDFELQFSHKVSQMLRFSQADMDATTFLYILKDDSERLLYCYMYQAQTPNDVAELYRQMKEQSSFQQTRSLSSANLTSLCVDISPSLSNFFEVLYIGKIKVWNRKVPGSFIDDALERFKQHEQDKEIRSLGSIGRLKSEDVIVRRESIDSNASESSSTDGNVFTPIQRSFSSSSNLEAKSSDVQLAEDCSTVGKQQEEKNRNRTMVLQVDRTDLRLISPDRKIILLHRSHKDVVACLQGVIAKDHFGFVCKETGSCQGFTGYVFKCKSDAITNDTVTAIKQASNTSIPRPKSTITSCDLCPMIWFHKLCSEIENLSDKKTQATILRKIEQLEEDEQNTIMTKFRGAETDSVVEQNEFLMMLLRAHCEMKQGQHVHDTAENRSEFLNQYLGGGTIFMKAKRSLSNSFEILKKRASRDDLSATLKEMHAIQNKGSQSPSKEDLKPVSKHPDLQNDKPLKSPLMDIFFKVGSQQTNDDPSPKMPDGSWRQAIFKKVVTPNQKDDAIQRKRDKTELRELWRKAINQAILLVRMEKENDSLKAKQEESAVKRIKLEYDELKFGEMETSQFWDLVTEMDCGKTIDRPTVMNAIRRGIPRGKRGDVWQFLAKQFCMSNPPTDTSNFLHYNTPYETLLKELTSHQHAILIDLGRTFPNHSYYSSPLGPGQLALFNLLKAYSLLDPEVGYCQGLSFVVGVLLLHMEESKAFLLLRHLMFNRGLRKQYLPDMTGLQIRLYQLSRLLHDKLPDLYEHFNKHDIAPTLYAAPWVLTIFASQFSLGFVTRIFDLLFVEGMNIVFKVALALLSIHKDKILLCEGFEEIMNYLKSPLTQVDESTLNKIIEMIHMNEITSQLIEYEIEYNVLKEEMFNHQPQLDQTRNLEQENIRLKEQNKKLTTQLELALSNVQRLEKGRTLHQAELNRQEIQIRSLELTVSTLGNFIHKLEDDENIEIPGDIRRIVNHILFADKKRNSPPNKLLVKSLSTGLIQTNNLNNDIRSNSLNNETKEELRQKTSNFFSNQHNNILKQKVYKAVSPSLSNSSIEAVIQEQDDEETEDNNNKNDSNAPNSPNNNTHILLTTSNKEATEKLDNHPLSNCDVPLIYNGTRELKHLRSFMQSRKSSPNLIQPQ